MWYGRLCVTTRPLLSPCTGSQSLDTALCIEHVPSFGRTRLAGEVLGFSLHTHVFSSRIHMQILISIIKRSACISLIKIKKSGFTTVMVWKFILHLPFEKLCSQNLQGTFDTDFKFIFNNHCPVWWLSLCTLPLFVCYSCVFYLCHAKDTQNFYLWKSVNILDKC